MRKRSRFLAFVLASFAAFAQSGAAVIPVTNINDSGAGSLRQAITDSNASVGVVDTITFNINATGVQTIAPATLLPNITDPVVIDGYTQPGASPNTLTIGDNAVILIELAGTGGISAGINISAGNSTVRGLAFTRVTAGASGAIVMSTAGNNVVEGCFVGVNPSGTAASANGGGVFIFGTAPGNRIGGTSPAQRNIISGQTGFAISVSSPNNVIAGNYIGTDASGKVKIPNGTAVGPSGANNTVGGTAAGAGNVISGNVAGLNIQSTGWVVQGNLIGTDATGKVALGNSGVGVRCTNGSGHTIGGPSVAARNIISANQTGISLNATDGTTIQGNYIGTDVTGTVALPNTGAGIQPGNSAMNTTIGGLTAIPGQPPGNIISATVASNTLPGYGIHIIGNLSPSNDASGTVIQGNLIGTDVTGLRALGNRGGIHTVEQNVTIGGTDPKAANVIAGCAIASAAEGAITAQANNISIIGNVIGTDISGQHPLRNAANGVSILATTGCLVQQNRIAFNGGSGIRAGGDSGGNGTGYRITQNAISYNGKIGIDLVKRGETDGTPTANDPGDADTGVNGLQNFPVITSAVNDNTNTTVTGTLNSLPNATYQLEFFTTSVRNSSGFGEGENFIGSASATTDASGNASFNLTFPKVNDGQWITATATDAAGNTLEFSSAVAVSGLSIVNGTAITARTNAAFRFRMLTVGGDATQRISATNLPPGLGVDAVTGVISGTPTADGSYLVQLSVVDGNVTSTAQLEITCVSDPGLPVIISPSVVVVPHGQLFSYTIEAPAQTTSNDVTTYSIYGPLPLGLTFNAASGVISGNVATVRAIHIGESERKALSGGALLGLIQMFATNSHGTTTSPLTLLQLPPMPVNISTRLSVGMDENVLIGGFIITGNAPKLAIVRAIGPSLATNGLQGALNDTVLELRDKTGAAVAVNDDWRTDQEVDIRGTGIPPSDERESAIVAVLNPASYTAVLRGKSNSTGIGLVEAYDLGTASSDIGSAAQFANLSTRGFVRTENDVMIGGLIAANGTAKLLLRAIGPSLIAAGVQNALRDPVLELHSGDGTLIGSNDNWKIRSDGSSQQAEIEATTVPPTDELESALVQTVAPGNYTAVVRGKNNTTGVGLVEIYNLQ